MIELIIFSSVVIAWLLFMYCVKISPSPVFIIDKEFLQKMEKLSKVLVKGLNATGITVQQATEAFQNMEKAFAKIRFRRL